ncbi:MAG: putative bifunctional diguanylate cyclase/phosphodiesterase [Methyloligellaceae bacterium]
MLEIMGISKKWSESRKKIYAFLDILMDVRIDEARNVAEPANTVALLNTSSAVILTIATWEELNRTFLISWLACSIFIFFFICNYNRRYINKLTEKYLTPGNIIKLTILISLIAVPWTVIAYPILGSGSLRNSLLIFSISIGAASGGCFMLFRIPLAAFLYIFVAVQGIGVTIVLKHFDDLWPIFFCAIGYSIFLMIAVILSWRVARESENNFIRASKANKKLRKANNEIRQMASHDSLTGLLNRKAFIEKLERRIAQKGKEPFAVFLLDLYRFKNINDSIGHGAGDMLLKIISERLQNAVTHNDIIARFGGDEFALIIEISNHSSQATDIADKILAGLNRSVTIERSVIHPNASIGIAFFPNQSETAEEFISQADMALHHAKENGRGQYQLYSGEMAAYLEHADKIENTLREAIDAGRIEVWYQPKIDLKTQSIAGAEALLRCFDTRGNIIPTEEILNIAGDRGIIPQISKTVFEKIKTDIKSWRTQNVKIVPIAINIHDFDLKTSDWLISQLKDMLNDGIDKSDIQLEVTEGCFVGRGSDAAAAALDMIDEMGIRLSLDDFGTGHAALSHLKRLPVSEIKIDQEFIKGINQNASDEAITYAAVEIARRMGITCVAEGVEKKEQLELLESLLQDGTTIIGQGHYWAPPMSVNDFISFIESWQQSDTHSEVG